MCVQFLYKYEYIEGLLTLLPFIYLQRFHLDLPIRLCLMTWLPTQQVLVKCANEKPATFNHKMLHHVILNSCDPFLT